MRAKSMVLIVIALGCGLVASIAISQVMERGNANNAELETVPIYVAMSDIDVNDQLAATNVRVEDWPKTKIPEGATTNFEDIKDRFARTRMYEGEPILIRKLVDEISGPAIQIPDGFRVFSLKVRMDTAVSNLVRPGDRVDIFGYFRAGQDVPKTGTREILRNVRVFAVNSDTEQVSDQDGETIVAKTVSVLVKQEQVAKLMLATELGTLSLALRRPNESEDSNQNETATIETLFGTRSEGADLETTQPKGPGKATALLQFFAGLTPSGSATPGSSVPTGTVPVALPGGGFPAVADTHKPAWQMTILTPDGNTEFTWNDATCLPNAGGAVGGQPAPTGSASTPAPWLSPTSATPGRTPAATGTPLGPVEPRPVVDQPEPPASDATAAFGDD